jgi:hypothetical protein
VEELVKFSPHHLIAVILVICASHCSFASDVYVSQNKAGGNTGDNCADARALSSLVAADWIPGNTIHLRGAITSPAGTAGLVAQGSGTSARPITIKFEPGAVLEAPYFGGTPIASSCYSPSTCLAGIEIFNYSNIIIDGGTSGVIENTANGTDLANHQSSSGITIHGGSNFIVRNLTIRNIYINDPSTQDTAGSYTDDVQIWNNSSNVTVCNNTLLDARIGLALDISGGVAPSLPLPSCASNTFSSGNNVFGNTLADHAWQIQPSGGSSPIVNIFNNSLGTNFNWVETSNNFHTDGIIAWGDAGVQLSVYLFNNVIQTPTSGTAGFYCTYGQTASGCRAWVFNNMFFASPADTGVAVWLNGSTDYPLGPFYLFNNTFVNNSLAVQLAGDNEAVTIENNLIETGLDGYFYAKGYGSNSLPSVLAIADYNSFYGGRGYSFTGNGQYFCWPQSGGSPSGCGSNYHGPWVKTGFDTHSVSANPQIDLNFRPSDKSPVINAGVNLSSLCSVPGWGPLCHDKNGVARPLAGRWDIGAIEGPHPNPPVGLTGTAR